MPNGKIGPGDWVEFIDIDQNRWGPWKVLTVADGKAQILVENMLIEPIPLNRIQRTDSMPSDSTASELRQ